MAIEEGEGKIVNCHSDTLKFKTYSSKPPKVWIISYGTLELQKKVWI